MAVQATRRMVLLLVTALMVVAMMAATATSAFAEPKGRQTPENSCGASNPDIGFPQPLATKGMHSRLAGSVTTPTSNLQVIRSRLVGSAPQKSP
jgi:hypothetical protein